MLATPNGEWVSFMTSGCEDPTLWDEYIKPLQEWLAKQSMERLSGLGDLLRRADEEGGAALAEVKAVIATAPADMQSPLENMVGAMAVMEQLRAQCQVAKTASQLTPFTKANKKGRSRILRCLTAHLGRLQQDIDALPSAGGVGEGPAIQRAGVQLQWLQPHRQ